MTQKFTGPEGLHPAIAFWSQIWQAQIEQSLRIWALWAQFVPKGSAAELAAEAEALKPVVRTTRAKAAAAPKPAAPKVPAKPLMAVVASASPPKTAPSKAAPPKSSTPMTTAPTSGSDTRPNTAPAGRQPRTALATSGKAGSADPAKPVIIH